MLKFSIQLVNLVLNFPAILAIVYFWQPIYKWYFSKIPALGVDLYLSATYATYHLKSLNLPFNSFKDFWFGGNPLIRDIPQLAFYLMAPFVSQDGPVVGIQKFTMYALVFFAISCYLLYFKLSKNHGLSLFLAVLILLSANIYGSAIWAGSIPYFFSQFAFPLGLLAGVFFLENPSFRTVTAMSLVTGIGFMVHPLGVLAHLIPSLSIIIIFGSFYHKLKISRIFFNFVFYQILWLMSAFIVTHDYVLTFLSQRALPASFLPSVTTGATQASEGAKAIAEFYKNQIRLLNSQTDPYIFKLLMLAGALVIIGFLIAKQKKRVLVIIPFLLITIYTAAHPALNLGGILSFFRHDPYRAFWQFPVALGALAAACWGFFSTSISQRLKHKIFLHLSFNVLNLALSLVFAVVTIVVFNSQMPKLINILESSYEASSAFPEALGLKTSEEDQARLAKDLLPSFIDPRDRNRRLYSADATVNIWWNAFYETPLARGYIDPPVGAQSRGGFFWLDIAIANDSIVRDFKIEENVAFNNALFLIDWYGIGYFEGGRGSSRGPNPAPSSYLLKNNVIEKEEERVTHGVVLRWLTASGKPEVNLEVPQSLHFYKFKDEFTSPILYPTNASPVLIFSNYPGYEDILRILASQNINSKKLIPVNAKRNVDKFSEKELKVFDAVFLHQYAYKNKNKAFSTLEKYVKEGGKLFIDTGGEVKESESENLSEMLPFKKSTRRGFGMSWNFEVQEADITKDIDFSSFGPPIFNDDEWKISTPQNPEDLREGSKVLLKHQGKPVVIERDYGKGKVIWSGLNLAYHYNQYKKEAESSLFINILKSFVDISQKNPLPAKTQWVKSEKVLIESPERPGGILFKEQGYDGWHARFKSSSKNLPIYLAGPTFPGFMYIPVGNVNDTPVRVEFNYAGRVLHWFVALVNLITITILLDIAMLNGRIFGKLYKLVFSSTGRKVTTWWGKEEEE